MLVIRRALKSAETRRRAVRLLLALLAALLLLSWGAFVYLYAPEVLS